MNTLSNLYRIAIQHRKVRVNPLNEVKRFQEDNEVMWVLTEEEEDRLLEACDSIEEEVPYLKNLVLIGLYSGMRLSEIFDMRKEHVNFKNEVVYIPDTKTHKSRKVPMNETLKSTLKSAVEISPGDWVFSNKSGERIRYLKSGFWKAVERAGLTRRKDGTVVRFRFHDLRHTFGSRLGQAGYDLKTIMEIMGHTTPRVALRYQHPTQDHKKAAVRSLDRELEMAPQMALEVGKGQEVQMFQLDKRPIYGLENR